MESCFPCVFFNCPNIGPGREGSSMWLLTKPTINIYFGFKLEVKEQTELFEKFIEFVNKLNSTEGLKELYTFHLNQIPLHGYFYGVEAYRFEITASQVTV